VTTVNRLNAEDSVNMAQAGLLIEVPELTEAEFERIKTLWLATYRSAGRPPIGLSSRPMELDPRWEWLRVERLGMPDEWIKIRCLHAEVIPVESIVTGETLAHLCLTCDEQLPAPQGAS